ncbi:MAG: M23 family metallopeptidase [Pseudomonadota bacterium]
MAVLSQSITALLIGFGMAFAAAGHAQCVDFDGALQQGGFIWGKVPAGSQVTLDGEQLDVLADGTTFAGFGRKAPATAELVVTGPQPCRETLKIAAREYEVQRVEGVPQETVTPPVERMERIKREAALVANARAKSLQRPDLIEAALVGLAWPTKGRISGVYGSERYYNGVARSPHYGIDIAVPKGTAVYAPAPGVATLAEPDLYFSGGTVILDHGYSLSSSFLHLSELSVAVGDEVEAGDVIGEVGSTGRSTGAHLDWRMNWRQHRIDPQLLVPPMREAVPTP